MQQLDYRSFENTEHLILKTFNTPVVLLDIETTGLSPDISTVFMIGCGYYENDQLHTVQWLADSLELSGEQDVLNAFSDWLDARFSAEETITLLTYNGCTFDIPFLKTRYQQCNVTCPFDSFKFHTLDLYRQFQPLKSLFPIKNMKLKTLSSWLGYHPQKTPEGRQLIKAYHTYIKTQSTEEENLLFLHNRNDLEALNSLLSAYGYLYVFKGGYTIHDMPLLQENHMLFHINPDVPLPVSIDYRANDIQMHIDRDKICLTIPLYTQGLRYYYTDYKNYSYLTREDYAVHKSMAKYINKEHWSKATQENCYTWFLPDDDFMYQKEKQTDYIQMIFRLFGFSG